MIRFLLRQIILLFRWVPFPLLYQKANVLKFILQHVVRYRSRVIRANLDLCFPSLPEKEKQAIIGRSYANLADIVMESIKGLKMDADTLLARYVFEGHEAIHRLLSENKSCIVCCGHIGNWEWAVKAFGYHFGSRVIGLYKPITNKAVEAVVNQYRAESGLQLISTRETRAMTDQLPSGRLILMMGDQNPSNLEKAITVNFFGIATPCLHGIAKYARQYDLAVFFADIVRQSRGHYRLKITKLFDEAAALTDREITQRFMSQVEACIRRSPGDWLWSHKRFKNLNRIPQESVANGHAASR